MYRHPFRKSFGLIVLYSIIIIGIFVLQFRNESVVSKNIGLLSISFAQSQNEAGEVSLKNSLQVAFKGISFIADEVNPAQLYLSPEEGFQTKKNLMLELGKINRVLGREIPGAPHESFLIIDGTTGQNGVIQAKSFKEVTELTGIVITKMDGTSKGGIILSIRDEIGVPVRFIGLGEKMEDLEEFDLDKYLYGLLMGDEEK